MFFLDLTLPDAAANLALDEALLLEAEQGQGGEILRIWEWPTPVVVLGAACRLEEDVHAKACEADRTPILRRSSGGGTVLWGAGCLLYTLVLRFDREPALTQVRPSYAWILGEMAAAIGLEGIEPAGISDLAIAGRKFSGNAQQRKRDHVLHHGTILYNFDRTSVARYLKLPPRQPEYRANRPHTGFLCNVTLSRDEIAARLRRHWKADEECGDWPRERVRQLCAEKYNDPKWIRRL
jgi:lipoate-protein ligase A